MLPGGEEGDAAELLRVPERRFARIQALAQELLPGIVLQHEVGDQRVVRHGGRADLLAHPRPGLVLVEVVGRQQRAAAQGLLPEEQQWWEREQ